MPEDIWAELRIQRDILIEVRTLNRENITAKDDHESRIRKLEERKFPLPTLAVLLSLASVVMSVLMFVTLR